jgi:kumamolisin
VAVLNNALGSRVGFLNPLLYSALQSAGGLSDVTTGDNGAFQAGTGWDPVTGWGTPKGNTLLKVLVAAPPPPPPPGEPPPPPPPPPG